MQNIPFHRSFRFRFILLVLGVQVLFAIIAGGYQIKQRIQSEEQKALAQSTASLRTASAYVRNTIQSFRDKLSLLAVTPALESFDATDAGKFLKTNKVAGLFIPGERLALYNNLNELVVDNTMVSSGSKKKQFDGFNEIEPVRLYMGPTWRNRHIPVRTFGAMVQNYARANGVLTADFSFLRLQDFLKDFKIGQAGYIVILDQDGSILLHPDTQWTRTAHTIRDLGIDSLTVDYSMSVKKELSDGKEYSVQYLFDQNTKLGFLALVPQSEINQQIAQVRRTLFWLLLGLMIAMIALTIWVSSLLAKPLQALAATMEKVKQGDLSVESGIKRHDEIGLLAEGFDSMRIAIRSYIDEISAHRADLQKQVDERTAELNAAVKELRMLSRTDDLTGIPNRRDIMEKIQFEYHRAKRSHMPFAIIIGDIDKFKRFNDTYGHDCGDVVLRMVAQTLQASVRKNDYLARWGGEEFLIVLPETAVEGTKIVAERIRAGVEEAKLEYNGQSLQVTITLGVAFFDEGLGVDQSIQNADLALYKGKESGRNRVEYWTPGIAKE